jgi:hypothetical protein
MPGVPRPLRAVDAPVIASLRARVFCDAGLYAALFLFLAAQTAAGSAQHAHDAFVQGGQGNPAWLPWTLAGTPELLAILATLEHRERRKTHGVDADVRIPVAIIVGAVLVLMGAQLVTAQRSALGMFAAAWPALAFLTALVLVETRPRAVAAVKPVRQPRPKPNPSSERSTQETDRPDGQGDGIPADIPAALAALDDNARAVYAVLEQAGPGETLTAEQIRDRTGLDRNRAYRATKALLGADLVVAPTTGSYAARKIEAVA